MQREWEINWSAEKNNLVQWIAQRAGDLDGGDAADDLEEADPQEDLVHGGVAANKENWL